MIKKIIPFMYKNSRLIPFYTVLAIIILIYDWQHINLLEGILLLLILVGFISYKKQASLNEAHVKSLLDNVSDAIITINDRGIILTVNRTVEQMFGYQPAELVGENIKILMPEPYTGLHDRYLSNFLASGEKHVIGKTREVKALRRNGETFEVGLWVHQLEFNGSIEFMGIIRDISEREHIDQIKTEFISTVSHELRTPLTSIRGSLGMLKSGVLGEVPEKAARMVELAHNNTERLINLVNDILDVEKIQAGKMELKLEKLNLTELVRQSILANEAYAEGCHVSLQLDDNIADFYVYADSHRLQQVMANLISNAAKFSPENGIVRIGLSKQGGKIHTSVKDQGVGIPEEYRSKIFQKFSQVDSSDTRKKGGTGLGLNITKAIIEHHGGDIDYATETDKGSDFFFDLMEYQSETEEPAREAEQEVSSIVNVVNSVKNRGHILVLEDEKDIATLLSLLLQQQNFKVTTCTNTEDAKRLIKAQHFDAVTVDIRLPGQDGISFIQEIRNSEIGARLPVIIVSAEAELNKQTASASALRVIDWIDKPIEVERLTAALQQALKQPNDGSANILYVEDNEDLIEMMVSLLGNTARLTHAPNLKTAKEIIVNRHFDLLILDIGLPDGSGLDLIPLVQQQQPELPVIVFSAQPIEQETIQQVDAALVKSQVTNTELIDIINNLITPTTDA